MNTPRKSPQPQSNLTQHSHKTKSSSMTKMLMVGVIFLLIGMALGAVFIHQMGGQSDKGTQEVKQTTLGKDAKVLNEEQQGMPVLTVEVIQPQISQVSTNISADGIVTAKSTASVSSKVAGLAIETVRVQEGQWVNQGDILATFDAKSLRQNAIQAEASVRQAEASVKQSQANLVQAQVNLTKAEADLNRVLPLLKIGAVSQQQVDSYKAQLAQAQASVASAVQAVASAQESVVSANAQANNQKINLMDTQLLAPVSGVVREKNAQVGAVPQGALFTIIKDGLLEWQAELSPNDVSQLKVGQPVAVKGTANQLIRGKINRINPVANGNRQIPVYVSLESTAVKKAGIQSGMLLTGSFITGVEPQLVLPVSALTSNDGYDYLMTVTDIANKKDDNGKAETVGKIKPVKVQLGRQENNAVIIKTQLPPSTEVVRQGGSFLSEGDLVRVVKVGGNK